MKITKISNWKKIGYSLSAPVIWVQYVKIWVIFHIYKVTSDFQEWNQQ